MKAIVVAVGLLIVLLGGALVLRSMVYSPAAIGAQRDLAAANDRMMAAMSDKAVVYLGDPDVDFRTHMIPHHKGAVGMAKVALQYSKDPEIRKLAEDIIKAQDVEIAQMESFLRKRGTN